MALINLPAARKRLVASIAAVPEGVKLSIPQLRDALVSQADILTAIAALIAEGKLDAASLRPPIKAQPPARKAPVGDRRYRENKALRPPEPKPPSGLRRGQSANDVPARPLFDALVAEGERRGLSVASTSFAMFANKARIYSLLKTDRVRSTTADRIRAWIADAPPMEAVAVVRREPVAELPAAPARQPAPLVVRVDANVRKVRPYCTQRGNCVAPSRGPCRLCQPARPPSFDGDPRPCDARRSVAIRKSATTEASKLLDANPEATVGRNAAVTHALIGLKDQRAAVARQANPVEQAKLALQRKGLTVHDAAVTGGRKGFFIVSGQRDPDSGRLLELAPAALLQLAERKTDFRRSAR